RRDVAGDQVRDARSEDRVDQQGGPVKLYQPARMAEPGDAPGLARSWSFRQHLQVWRDRRHRRAGGAPAAPPRQAIEDGPAEDCAPGVGSGAVEVRETHGYWIVRSRFSASA